MPCKKPCAEMAILPAPLIQLLLLTNPLDAGHTSPAPRNTPRKTRLNVYETTILAGLAGPKENFTPPWCFGLPSRSPPNRLPTRDIVSAGDLPSSDCVRLLTKKGRTNPIDRFANQRSAAWLMGLGAKTFFHRKCKWLTPDLPTTIFRAPDTTYSGSGAANPSTYGCNTLTWAPANHPSRPTYPQVYPR